MLKHSVNGTPGKGDGPTHNGLENGDEGHLGQGGDGGSNLDSKETDVKDEEKKQEEEDREVLEEEFWWDDSENQTQVSSLNRSVSQNGNLNNRKRESALRFGPQVAGDGRDTRSASARMIDRPDTPTPYSRPAYHPRLYNYEVSSESSWTSDEEMTLDGYEIQVARSVWSSYTDPDSEVAMARARLMARGIDTRNRRGENENMKGNDQAGNPDPESFGDHLALTNIPSSLAAVNRADQREVADRGRRFFTIRNLLIGLCILYVIVMILLFVLVGKRNSIISALSSLSDEMIKFSERYTRKLNSTICRLQQRCLNLTRAEEDSD